MQIADRPNYFPALTGLGESLLSFQSNIPKNVTESKKFQNHIIFASNNLKFSDKITTMIITIDGPAGSGKSTTARNLAKALEISFLDTGATYRAVTYQAIKNNIDLTNEDQMAKIACNMNLEMRACDQNVKVICDGQDISDAIRTEQVSRNAKYAATPPKVREILVELQRKMGSQLGNFVTEGRDQGTVVFPDADFKFYAETSPEVRAKRRVCQLEQMGQTADYNQVLADIIARDESDQNRKVGPLKKPADAIIIDTGKLDPDQVILEMLKTINA